MGCGGSSMSRLDKNDMMTATVAESSAVAKRVAEENPHLIEEFAEVDEVISALRNDPIFENGGSIAGVSQFYFSHKADDLRKIGDYYAKGAHTIENSYRKILDSFNVKCWAAVTEKMIENSLKAAKRNLLGAQIRFIVSANTSSSFYFCEKICNTGMLMHILEDLKFLKVKDVPKQYELLDNTFELSLQILHNCSRNPATRSTIRSYNTVKILLPYLKCGVEAGVLFFEAGKLWVLITLAHLTDEKENKGLLADKSVLDILFDTLNQTWTDFESDHRIQGMSVEVLVDGLVSLAQKVSTKAMLVEKGVVPILINVMEKGYKQERERAVKCIHELSSDKTNGQSLSENVDLMKLLTKLSKSRTEKISQSAVAALSLIHDSQ